MRVMQRKTDMQSNIDNYIHTQSHSNTSLIWDAHLFELFLCCLFFILFELEGGFAGEPVLHKVEKRPVNVGWQKS